MEKSRRCLLKKLFALIAGAMVLFVIFAAFRGGESYTAIGKKNDELVTLTSNGEMLDIVKNGATDYSIVFSGNDDFQNDLKVMSALRVLFIEMGISRVNYGSDSTAGVSEHEILIGKTNREYSTVLTELAIKEAADGEQVWIIAEKDSKIYFTANSDAALLRGKSDFFAFASNSGFSIPKNYFKVYKVTKAELEEEEAQNKALRIEELKNAIAGFVNTDFTGGEQMDISFTVMPDSPYESPYSYPTKGEHPRLNVSSYMLSHIREYVEKTAEGQELLNKVKAIANSDYDGVLPPASVHTTGRIGKHNMDEEGLAVIEARAFLYLLTGDVEYGYSAVLTMKNYLKTFELIYITSDMCREFGRVMVTTAEVYDWCYYLLSEKDKEQFIVALTYIASGDASVRYNGEGAGKNTTGGDLYMEVGYPPSGQGAIQDHGAEAQILRDYFSAAIAIFDENESWYEYVAGRIYQDYVPFRNYYYSSSGMYPQGAYNYAYHRHYSDLWNAWIFVCAVGENPYVDELQQVTNSLLAFKTPGERYFGTGDGKPQTKYTERMMYLATIVSAMYGDMGLREVVLDYFGGSFQNVNLKNVTFSETHLLVFSAAYFKKVGSTDYTNLYDGVDPVVYNSYPIGEMITRREWNNPDVPASYMKIGEKTTAGHEHLDAGTFQLFYKGLYCGESGKYDRYGSIHHLYYYEATVAHNGLLIYNPALSADELNGSSVENSTNLSSFFYTGGQRSEFNTNRTFESWLNSSDTNTGTVTGHEYALTSDGLTDYAYLAGDITLAYDSTQASYVGRSMFTLYTDNPEYPMFFIVYDAIDNVSESHVNKFLLHTPAEPIIDEDKTTVTIKKDDAKLVLKSLKGTKDIVSYGGEGKEYLINGVQCDIIRDKESLLDDTWGRVELHADAKVGTELLNVLYYTDADNDSIITPTLIENDKIIGTKVDNAFVLFSKSHTRNSESLTFTTEGKGVCRYMMLGLHEGTWHISVDGVLVAHSYSSKDGGMISFSAPCGEVTLTPGADIAPANGGRIIYNTFGGVISGEALQTFTVGDIIVLPEEVNKGNDIFLGWYTSPDFEESTRVTEIIPEIPGNVQVYAKYMHVLLKADFEEESFDISEVTMENSGISFMLNKKVGSTAKTVTENGNTYVRISVDQKDATIRTNMDTAKIGNVINSGGILTYEIDLAAREDGKASKSSFMIRSQLDGRDAKLNIFKTNTAGNIVLGDSGLVIGKLTTTLTKYVFTLDINSEKLTAYDEYGEILGECALTVPEVEADRHNSFVSWFSTVQMLFNFQVSQAGGLCFDNLYIYATKYESNAEPIPENSNKLVLDAMNGRITGAVPTYYTAGVALSLPEATSLVEPLIFSGWYTDKNFSGEPITELNMENSENPVTLYAKYVYPDNMNELRFELGAGSVNISLPTYYTENLQIELPTPTPDDPMKVFYGWYLNPDFSGVKITSYIPVNAAEPLVFYAKYAYPDNMNTVEFKVGVGIIDESVPEFYYVGEALVLPVPKATSEYENFGGWYLSSDFSGEAFFGSYTATDASLPIVFYAKWIMPEGVGKIEYVTNGGVLDKDAPTNYYIGTELNLPIPVFGSSDVSAEFMGWYREKDFSGAPIFKIDESETDSYITLYAMFKITLADEDYTNSDVTVVGGNGVAPTENTVVNGVVYSFKKKYAGVTTETDEKGNLYLRVTADKRDPSGANANCDPQISVENTYHKTLVRQTGGIITYEMALKIPEGGKIGNTLFRLRVDRESSGNDVIAVFSTGVVDGTAYVFIGEDKTQALEITEEFTRVVFTVNLIEGNITAYDGYDNVFGTLDIAVPAGADNSANITLLDWFEKMKNPFQWYFKKGGCDLAFDDLKVYTGRCTDFNTEN